MLHYTNPYYFLLFVLITLRFVPEDKKSSVEYFKEICEYDTKKLCPECFPNSLKCDEILFTPLSGSWSNIVNNLANAHHAQIGTYAGHSSLAVLKRLNRKSTIEQLLREFCKIRSTSDCSWTDEGSVDQATAFLKTSILEKSRVDGCVICPSNNKEQSLQRFLETVEPSMNNLLKLLVIRTNVQPLLLTLMSVDSDFFPVPTLLCSFGFNTIETYDGEPMSNFYGYPLVKRMLIARELIKAVFSFTVGINGFRFLLTDINPDNVVVRFGNDPNEMFVSFVDLDNLILMDSLADGITDDYNYHAHTKIECDGCFAYVQADICRYRNSDLNFFAICQLLLEDTNGNSLKGLLHGSRSKVLDDPTLPDNDLAASLHNLLHECVYCRPPACRNRSLILENILNIIDINVI